MSSAASEARTENPTPYRPLQVQPSITPDLPLAGDVSSENGSVAKTRREATPLPLAIRVEDAGDARLRNLPTVTLAGVALHAVTEQQAVDVVIAESNDSRGGMVITPNLDHLYRAQKGITFSAHLAEAELVVADGMPLVWASRCKGQPLPERVAGSNLIVSLSEAAARHGKRIFLLGGEPGTADGSAVILQARFPGLVVCGTYCPPHGFEYDTGEMGQIVEMLKAAKPDIIFVGLGSPKQENTIGRLRRTLPGAWWLGVGVSFSFLTGRVRRAPRWMQRIGLEWLHRLSQEPKRLFRRYVVVGIPFAARLLVRSLLERVTFRLGLAAPGPSKRHVGDLRVVSFSRPPASARQESLLLADPRAVLDADANAAAVESAVLSAATAGENAVRRLRSSRTRKPEDVTVDTAAVLSRLRGMILLGGKVRPSPFTRQIGRPILELPLAVREGVVERLTDHWLRQADDVARLAGLEWLPVRVLVSDESDAPSVDGYGGGLSRPAGGMVVERDLGDYRGTGGVLRDLAAHHQTGYEDDDVLLVCNAGQVLIDPLPAVVRMLAHKGGDITVVAHDDGTPSGMMLVTVKTLRQIPSVGYVDMKEQALPRIAERWAVRAVHCRRPTAMTIRTHESYLAALRRYHGQLAGQGRGVEPDPLDEDLRRHFAVVEPGAYVDEDAHLHDSVVLAGGHVEAGAAVVRSVVCAGGTVSRGDRALETLVMLRRRSLQQVVAAGV